ncbi:MAG: competence protein ComEA [Thermodesulfobacterium sp.]|jgi:competence protein ComEA|nr:competence protein ComEA [Thermodesulfobacterium sp.]
MPFHKRGGLSHPFLFFYLCSVGFLLCVLLSVSLVFAKKLDINQATVEDLEKLPGIGKKTAQAIVDYREKNGPFKSWEDVEKVKGIGPKKLQLLKPYLTLGEEGEKAKQEKKSTSKSRNKNLPSNLEVNNPIYYYVDEKGKVHYTQFPQTVPSKYRNTLKPLNP